MSKILKNSFFGGLGFLVPMLSNFVGTPILISLIGEEQYGLQSIAVSMIGYLTVAEMGMDIPITKYVSEFTALKKHSLRDRIVVNTLIFYTIIGFTGCIVFFTFSKWLTLNVFDVSSNLVPDAINTFRISGFTFLATVITTWGRAILNGKQRYDIANTVYIINNLGGILLGLLLAYLGYGIVGFLGGKALTSSLAGGFYLFYNLSATKIRQSINYFSNAWHQLKSDIGYGFLIRISGSVFLRLDQYFIGAWMGLEFAGYYAIPYLLASSIWTLISKIIHFAFPLSTQLINEGKVEEYNIVFRNLITLISNLSIILFVPFILWGDHFLSLWVGESISEESAGSLRILSIAFLITGITTTGINAYIFGLGKLKFFTFYSFVKGLMLLAGYIILIPIFGIEGAALSVLIACSWEIIYAIIVLKKFILVDNRLLIIVGVIKPMTSAIVTLTIVWAGNNLFIWHSSLIHFVVNTTSFIVLFSFISYLLKSLGQFEMKLINLVFNNLIQKRKNN